MTELQVFRYVAQWAALAPLLAYVVLRARKRPVTADDILLSATFAVSFVADLWGARLAAMGINNLWLGYVYAPIQFALFAYVFVSSQLFRRAAFVGLALLALVSFAASRLDIPETVVQVVGGAALGLFVLEQRSPYRTPILVYSLAAIPFLLLMGRLDPATSQLWLYAWIGYQATRMTALGLMVRVLFRPRLRLEVEDDPGRSTDLVGARLTDWNAGVRARRLYSASSKTG